MQGNERWGMNPPFSQTRFGALVPVEARLGVKAHVAAASDNAQPAARPLFVPTAERSCRTPGQSRVAGSAQFHRIKRLAQPRER